MAGTAQQYVEILQEILGLDASIIDSSQIRIAGSSRMKQRIGGLALAGIGMGLGIDLFKGIKHGMKVVAPVGVICAILYLVIGFSTKSGSVDYAAINELTSAIESHCNLNILVIIPMVIVFSMLAMKPPSIPSLLTGAVGDGNHSLATTKSCYEELKKNNPGVDLSNHPARYALVELENIHDPAQVFEPIHSVIFKTEPKKLLKALEDACGGTEGFPVKWYTGEESGTIVLDKSKGELAVGILQHFLDEYLKEHAGEIKAKHLTPARCPLFGYALVDMKLDGQYVRQTFLRPETQSKLGTKGYDAGAKILTYFFKSEIRQYPTQELDELGRSIIECCLNDGTLDDYLKLTPM